MIKQKMISIIICFLTFQTASAGMVFGKCPIAKYEITGVVQEEKTNELIADAKLFFFLDDAQSTFANGYETKYPDYFKTNTQGSFTAAAWMDTYSGWFPQDRCNRKPKLLSVITVAEGYMTSRINYKLKKLIGPDGSIHLPPIVLRK
jgi:hypothetical protein